MNPIAKLKLLKQLQAIDNEIYLEDSKTCGKYFIYVKYKEVTIDMFNSKYHYTIDIDKLRIRVRREIINEQDNK